MRRTAHEVGPLDDAVIEQETPVRPATLGLKRRALLLAQRERRAVVDRRQPARGLSLAPPIEFVLGLVAGVEPAGGLERFDRGVVQREALRLPHLEVGDDAEPCEVAADRLDMLLLRARNVGVVEAQDEPAAVPAGEQRVEQRRPRIADVEPAGRRRGEADDGRAGHQKSTTSVRLAVGERSSVSSGAAAGRPGSRKRLTMG